MRINSIYASAFTQAFIPINWLEDNALATNRIFRKYFSINKFLEE